jgi:hypothetical protein
VDYKKQEMIGDTFFDIPIYSMNPEGYKIRIEKSLQKSRDGLRLKKDNPNYEDVNDLLRKQICIEWEYNQIIGYLKLYRLNDRIYAEVWKIDKKRMSLKLKNKVFKYFPSYPEWNIDLKKLKTSQSIYEKLLKELPNDMTGLFKKYFLDLRLLKEIGPYIDWVELLNKYK